MTLLWRSKTNRFWRMCGFILLEGGGEQRGCEMRRICVGRKRSLYAKAITYLVRGAANTRRGGERKRGQRGDKYTCGQALGSLNVCFHETSRSQTGISEPRRRCGNRRKAAIFIGGISQKSSSRVKADG